MSETITLENGNEVTPGCWLEGWHGWTNSYRVVDLAVSHGMELDPEDAAIVEWYRRTGDSDTDASDETLDKLEAMTGQGGISDKASEYLGEQLPEGWVVRWDAGEMCVLRAWEDCAADGNGCDVDTDAAGNIVLVKLCRDHNPCEGHADTDDVLTSGAGIGETIYCDGSCVPQG